MVISIHFDKEYIKKAGIKLDWKNNRLIAIVPSSYTDEGQYIVDVENAAKRKRELFEKWHRDSMELNLTDMIYEEFPYDVARFIIEGIEVY